MGAFYDNVKLFQTPKNSMTVPSGGDSSSYAISLFSDVSDIPSTGSATTTTSITINETNDVLVFWINRLVYTISYDACGGSGAPSNQSKRYGRTLTLSSTTPTMTSYNFSGWATDSCSGSVVYSAGDSYTANESATLYAIYSTTTIPTFTYTGNYEVVDDDDNVISDVDSYEGNWKIRFLTSGTFESTSDVLVDVFLVGGGGGGGFR